MTIPWIKCSDRMPPDDVGYQIIIKFKIGRPMPYNAQQLNRVNDPNVEWIPFSWSNLNAADKEWEQSKLSK